MQVNEEADVVIVGGGPAGASAAHYLAQQGLDVLVLERALYPRDKVCGDGLTPRAVSELIRMAVPIRERDGWVRNYGLCAVGGGHRISVPWPELESQPNFGTAKPRKEFDHLLIRHAQQSGARVWAGMSATSPLIHEASGRVIGVRAHLSGQGYAHEDALLSTHPLSQKRSESEDHAKEDSHVYAPYTGKLCSSGDELLVRAKFTIDASGVSARMAKAVGREQDKRKPMGVAVRTYFESPLARNDYMESHLELRSAREGQSECLPGYAWIFPVGNGLVNVGLGSLSSRARATGINYRAVMRQWLASTPPEWGLVPENQRGALASAALPMAFNRQPHYAQGLALIGDAGGMVSPFNGEGIAYALASGRIVAEYIGQALARPQLGQQDRVMRGFTRELKDELGGYYTLGRIFAALIEKPEIMHLCVRYGLPRPVLMQLVMKLLSDAYDRRGGDWMDRVIAALTKAVPSA